MYSDNVDNQGERMNKSPATETGCDFAHDYAIRGMLNIGELKNYCYQNKISIRQQYALVKRNYLEVYDLDYCKELFKFMKELKAVLDTCLDEEAEEKPPQNDVVKPSSEVLAKNTPEPPQPLQIGHFQLTETGRKIELHTWNEMVASMVSLMHLPDEAREDWLYLLGVASEHKRTKPLDHKVVFNSSIMTLTFWIGMMVGNFTYPLPHKVTIGQKVMAKGDYTCPPLIRAPRGEHWNMVKNGVQYFRHGHLTDIHDTKQLISSKKERLNPQDACPILKALEPLGCRLIGSDNR